MQGNAAQGPAIRKHARVVCDDVAAGIKIEDTEEWIQVAVGDLSLGGAFLVTDRFIVEGTQVDVGFAFPSGIRLFFVAEVARAVAASARGPAGLGVQFLSPTSENVRALSREMEPRMQAAPPPRPPPPTSSPPSAHLAHQQPSATAPAASSVSTGGVLELTTTIYERLRLPTDCDDAALLTELERLIASVDSGIEQVPHGRQRDQALVFKQTLERMRPMCQDPIKRAAYDFQHGIVRAEERIAAAAAHRGPPLLKLQEAWKRIFMTEVREAKRLFMEARRGSPDAAQLMAQAIELDPFNPQYRAPARPQPPPPGVQPAVPQQETAFQQPPPQQLPPQQLPPQQASPQQASPQQPASQQPPFPQAAPPPAFQQPPSPQAAPPQPPPPPPPPQPPQQQPRQQPPPLPKRAPALSPSPFGPPSVVAPAAPPSAPAPAAAPSWAPSPQAAPGEAPAKPPQEDDFFGGLDE